MVNGLLPVAEPLQGTQQQVPVNHVATEAKRLGKVPKPDEAPLRENSRIVDLAGQVVESGFFCNPFFSLDLFDSLKFVEDLV